MTTKKRTITVTSPLLPNLDDFYKELEKIWNSKWITNMGQYHMALEESLAEYLHVPYVCLFTNGTLPLITALQALRITGEVITTPYSFVATTHSIWWNNCKPVFVDIDPVSGNMDPYRIEAAITPATTAIMPVHCYGQPCDTKGIKQIAEKYGLKVIYDAAHAFGVEVPAEEYGLIPHDDKGLAGIMNAGDMSTLSFHATKVYNTIEGGALIVKDKEMKRRIDNLKNFGITDEVTVVAPGINSKMDEMRSAYGLLNLQLVDEAIEKRKQIANVYQEELSLIPGITIFKAMDGIRHNYSYFPILVDKEKYGISRDQLYDKMKENGVLARRYFYPLISDFPCYSGLPSAKHENLPNAARMAERVLCLPMHHQLSENDMNRILELIIKK